MTGPTDLHVPPLATLHARRSMKWDGHPSDVLAATVAEMDFPVARRSPQPSTPPSISTTWVTPKPTFPRLAEALSGFAARRLGGGWIPSRSGLCRT